MNAKLNQNRKLNEGQLDVLYLLYKFRFGSNDLFAQYFGKKDRSFVHKRLTILLERNLIGKRYESSYRLQGKPAAYYLLPDGARALKANRDIDIDIKLLYKDKSASEQFITHNLAIFKIYCDLKTKHGDNLKFFTKSQLRPYEYFPDPLPDAYFRIATDDIDKPEQYFLEVLESTRPFFVSVRKARRYIEYDESGEWEETGTKLPTVLLHCDMETLRRRVDKQLTRLEQEADSEELKYIATSNLIKIDPFNSDF